MKKLCKTLNNKTIADLSGNVGGDTIRFGMNFKEVDSFELNSENFEALKNNVEVYDLKNVTLHLGDATKLFNKKVDFLYIDPPWGGPDYKDKKKLVLKFGSDDLNVYLTTILQQEWKPKYIFLKLPSNYDFETFTNLPNIHTTIHKFQIRGFYLLGIKTR
jgi:predicted RNA methylase